MRNQTEQKYARVARLGNNTYFITEEAYLQLAKPTDAVSNGTLMRRIFDKVDTLEIRVLDSEMPPISTAKKVYHVDAGRKQEEEVACDNSPELYGFLAEGNIPRHRKKFPSLEPESLASCLGVCFEIETEQTSYY